MATATITEISESSDAVWELVCRYEDGERITSREFRALSEADRQIFGEECSDIDRKHRRSLEFEALRKPRPVFRPSPRESGPDYENMILAQQEADWTWWT